ncbi:hypothetical protein A0J57_17090 [Sphingobium sp. 22B]|uniref:ABC transporter permease n=1 Tax=unclassified Sphingobium TaxID=2611147 RepID=UPI00078425F6|nr:MULTISPECIES: ABC transporter permease subunit [unclassified Sphingobium]KXU31503.1 hypothetical protein AXW74_12500 [Sphingobium sp. AM]KYC31157.1 hypothetical protein A0J57_17090 [Sphingobium sp. 22B]OAP31158.1 hypothetical protein A8O16_14995 [Sphingobium sp. 20006FA]
MKRTLKVAGAAYTLLVILFLLLPAIAVLPASIGKSEFIEFPPSDLTLDWYHQVANDSGWIDSAMLSLRIAILTAVVTTALALLFGIVQMRKGAVPRWAILTVLLPLWTPHVVLASGVFAAFLPTGLVGGETLLVLANTAMALPLSATLILASFATIDPTLWTAAASLGAKPTTILRTVVLPLVALGVAMSAILAFQSAWDETTFALFIGPVLTPVLSARMYAYVSQTVTPAIAAVSAIVTAVTLICAIVFAFLQARQRRRRSLATQ